MHGLQELADEFDVSLAGGDTNTWHGPCVVSVTLLGEVTGAGPVLRSGAQPGDWLMVSGALGGSLQGRHLWFEPRVRLAAQLQERVALHAMIDVSDGLGRDLRHVLRESRVGAVIDADRIPIHEDVDTSLPATDRLQQALADGEDFELLFAVTPADGQLLLEDRSLAAPVTRIGVVTAELDCRLREADGRVVPLPVAGWVHPF
jgi:thiamine-monophosphate kinase